jgi:hypothetical protein
LTFILFTNVVIFDLFFWYEKCLIEDMVDIFIISNPLKMTIKNTYNIGLTCLFLLTSWATMAQTTLVNGVVRDAKTGEGLPFADVYFVGTTIGLTTDMDGNYSIQTEEKVDSIGFLFLGYQAKNIKIKTGKTQTINVDLGEVQLMTEVATVTASKRRRRYKDTAAIALWRNVVRHWPANDMESAGNYYHKDYIKTGFDWYKPGKKMMNSKLLKKQLKVMQDYIRTEENGDKYLPVLHKETIKEIAHQTKPTKKIERVLADRFSGMENESMSDFIGSELDNVDPFKNVNIIAGKSFIGPFSAGSNLSYNYFLTDSIERDGDKFYLLTFVGKRKQDFTFLGNAWVHKPTFGVESIEMEISPHIALNHIQKLNIEQYYINTPEGHWVKDRETLVANAKIDFIDIGTRKDRNKKNQIRIRQELKRYDLKINTNLEENYFQGEEMQWADNSGSRDLSYWDEQRPEKLDTVSQGVYDMMDSVQRTPFYKFMNYLGYTAMTAHLKAGPVEIGQVPQFVSWNSIEGVRLKLGMRTSKTLSDKFQISGYGAYGFKDKDWKYGMKTIVHLPSKNRKWHTLSAWYKNDFEMLGQKNEMLTNDNIISSLTRGFAPMDDLMKIREATIYHEKDWLMGLYTRIGYRWRKFYSVENGFEFTGNAGDIDIPSFTSSEVRFKLHWGYKERFWKTFAGFKRYSMGTPHPVIEFEYTGGLEALGGDHTYHKLDFSLRHRWNTPLGYTRYQLHASKTFGNAPYPVLTVHLGNQSIVRNGHAYAMMNDFEFVSDQYAAVWIDHHFDGLIMNTIPLIKKLKWRTIFMFKALYGTINDSNRTIIDIPESVQAPNFYAEIGFGVENIFKMVRIDFMWRMTSLDNPGARPFGINLVLNPKF